MYRYCFFSFWVNLFSPKLIITDSKIRICAGYLCKRGIFNLKRTNKDLVNIWTVTFLNFNRIVVTELDSVIGSNKEHTIKYKKSFTQLIAALVMLYKTKSCIVHGVRSIVKNYWFLYFRGDDIIFFISMVQIPDSVQIWRMKIWFLRGSHFVYGVNNSKYYNSDWEWNAKKKKTTLNNFLKKLLLFLKNSK